MPLITLADSAGRAAQVNTDGLWILVRQYAHAKLMLASSRRHVESQLLGPDLITVTTDFEAVKREKAALAEREFHRLVDLLLVDREKAQSAMIGLRDATVAMSRELGRLQQSASAETRKNIERSVRIGELSVSALQAIRNTSATALVVGAGFLSGGAAWGALGAGSVLTGTGRYQESGRVGDAVLEAGCSFTVGMIGGAAKLAGAAKTAVPAAQKWAMIVLMAEVQGGFELAKGYARGDSISAAGAGALARMGLTVLTRGFLNPWLDKVVIPLNGKIITIPDTARTVIGTAVSAAGSQVVSAARSALKSAPPPTASHAIRKVRDITTDGNESGRFVEKNVLAVPSSEGVPLRLL